MSDAVFRIDGNGPVATDDLSELKFRATRWNTRAKSFFSERRHADQDRRCLWKGQNSGGQKWDEDQTDGDYGLFDGCSDLRERWADRISIEKAAVLAGALGMANVSISGQGPMATQIAGNLTTLLSWLRRSMGAAWLRSWMALINWYLSDSPAVALMAVRWKKENLLDVRTLTRDELAQAWLAREVSRAADEYAKLEAQERVGRIIEALGVDPASEMQAAALIAQILPGVTAKEARRAAKEIGKNGTCDVYVTSPGEEGIELEAKRFGDDFVIPDNSRDFEREGLWFVPEWVGIEDLSSRGWDETFVEEVMKQGEVPVLSNGSDGDPTPSGVTGMSAREKRRQVIWAYVTGIDAEGRKGKYVCVFGAGEATAFGWRLISGRKGRWPAVLFRREIMSQFVLDSRGVSELAAPMQGMAKAMWDGAANNALLGNTPPILAKGHSVRNQQVSPLRVIGMNVNEEFGYMRNPEYPASTVNVAKQIEKETKEYFGQAHPETDPATVAQRQRAEVAWFLAQATDVYAMMLELAQENMSDELLAAVTDDAGMPVQLQRKDIMGRFGITLELNADDLDTEKVIEKAKAVGQIVLAMDRKQIVDTNPLVSGTLCRLFPDMGPRALRSAEAAQTDELEDEANNLVKIRAGVMPRMNTDGLWNYAARLQMYEQMRANDPHVFDDMGQDKLALLERWLSALSQQATQFGKNREIGKTGVEGVGSEE